MIYLAIVDDKTSIRSTLEEKLNIPGQLKVLFTAQNGKEFLEKMTEARKSIEPAIVLMDIDMPLMNGIEAVMEGKKRYPNTKYLMLTIFDEDEKIFNAIKAGADGYMLKDESSDAIKSAISNLIDENGAPMSPSIARRALKLLMRSEVELQKENKNINLEEYLLTDREKEVLLLLIEGLEYKEISQKIDISPNTTRNHITKIYKKLHVSSQAQAMRLFQKG
ncbi:MAG: response regulator transcription factor [Bacteroidia bacterium]|nr:response regulator transcription factor [Bacteroidia bacterium]